jgi:predicted nucleic acid-binding protein
MLVISDTTCINYLILIEREFILPCLYGRIVLPQAVLLELTSTKPPQRFTAG